MEQKKIVCDKCDKSFEFAVEGKEFATVKCKHCQAKIIIPKVIGQFVLTEKVLENDNFTAYKGHSSSTPGYLSVKVLKTPKSFSKEDFFALSETVSAENGSGEGKVSGFEIDGRFIFSRPWINLSFKSYLEQKKPRALQVILCLQELCRRLKLSADKEKYYNNLSLNNLYLNDTGELVLTDLGLRDFSGKSLRNADFETTVDCLKSICAKLCCDQIFREGMKVKLSFRDYSPKKLSNFLERLFKANSFSDFTEIVEAIEKVDLGASNEKAVIPVDEKAVSAVDETKNNSSNENSKQALAEENTKSPDKKPVNLSKVKLSKVEATRPGRASVRKKNGFPLLLPVAVFLAGAAVCVYFLANLKEPKKEPVKVVKVSKAPKPKKIKKKEEEPPKPEFKAFKAPERVVEVEKVVETFDLSGEIKHRNFRQIMTERCCECHGKEGNKVEGKANLVKLMAASTLNPRHWKVVYDQIQKGEMPPEDEEPLTADEKEVLLTEIKKMALVTQITRSTRPLTPDEIKNTLVDLFDIDEDVYNPFTPLYANYSHDGFYSMQKDVITPFYLDDLYEALHDSLESYVALNPVVDPLNLKTSFMPRVHLQERYGEKSELRWGRTEDFFAYVNFDNLDKKEIKKTKNREKVGPASGSEAALEKMTIPPGTYKLSFDAQAMNMNLARINKKKYGSEVYKAFERVLKKHEYSLPVRFYLVPPNMADPHARTKYMKTVEVNASEMSRYSIEFTVNRRIGLGYHFPVEMKMPSDGGLAKMIAQHRLGNAGLKEREQMLKQFLRVPNYEFPMVRFKNVKLEGPFKVKVSDYSVDKKEKMDNLTIRKKFRTLHNDNYIQNNIPYDYIFDKFRKRQIGAEESYRNALVSFFMSPDFLTLEYDKKDKRKLVRMLSYMFHKTGPGKEIYDRTLAVKDRNSEEFTKWLVTHENFDRFIKSFSYQWFEMDALKGSMPEEKKFRDFYRNDRLKSYKEELNLFLKHLFIENRPVGELVTADYSFLNSDLAGFYDNGSVPGDGFSKYQFSNKERGGLLSSGAFLLATGNGVEALPIKRAKWILEKFLDSSLPPPPEDIDLEAFQQDLSKPLHERLKDHSKDSACYNCHKRIDPLAVMMNKFDTAGGRNNRYTQVKVQLNDVPVRDLKDLKKYLGSQDEAIARSFIKNILKYTLGRELYIQDGLIIDKIVKENADNKYPVRDLLNSMIKHYFF